jgi:hypothetical protein
MSKSHAVKMLDAIEAVLEGRITSDVEQYSIAGRQITKIPISELLILHDRYKAAVAQEKAAESIKLGLGNPNKVKVRF